MWLWKARGARSLDQAGEAAGVAEIELVFGALPQWSLGFFKVGQKGRGRGRKLRAPGLLGDHSPWGGEPGPLVLGGHWGRFSIGAGWHPTAGPQGPDQLFLGRSEAVVLPRAEYLGLGAG